MGWKKLVGIGGEVSMGGWTAEYNKAEKSIDILHASSGIPYIKRDTTFDGDKLYLELVDDSMQIEHFPGWADSVIINELYEMDDTDEFDMSDSGDILINYFLNTDSDSIPYEGYTEFISSEIDLTAVGEHYSSTVEWILKYALEFGADICVFISIRKGAGKWSGWKEIYNFLPIDILPTNLDYCKIKYKVVMKASGTETPILTEIKTTINSCKHFRVMSGGKFKVSTYVVGDIDEATVETLL